MGNVQNYPDPRIYIYCRDTSLLRITFTVAVVLLIRGGGGSLQSNITPKEVSAMNVLDAILKTVEMILTAADIILQYTVYKETKNDRHSSDKQ